MQVETIIALAKYAADQKAGTLTPGVHEVNEEIRLKLVGSISKSADVEYTPTSSVPWKLVTALLLERMGVTRDAAAKMILETCKEAIETQRLLDSGNEVAEHLTAKLKNISEAEKQVEKIVTALPKKTKSGPTKVNVVVTELAIAQPEEFQPQASTQLSSIPFPSIAG